MFGTLLSMVAITMNMTHKNKIVLRLFHHANKRGTLFKLASKPSTDDFYLRLNVCIFFLSVQPSKKINANKFITVVLKFMTHV